MGTSYSTDHQGSNLGYSLDKGYECSISTDISIGAVIALAEAAGEKVKEVYETKEAAEWNVELKSDNSPLTKADKESNTVICEALERLTPHIPIVSEENKAVDYEIRKHYQCSWCIDPLDGTKEFIKRNGQFTVNIALIEQGTPVLGVVHTPMAGTTHWAVKGQGAYVRFQGKDKQINCEVYDPEEEGLWVVASASHMNTQTEEFIGQFKNPQFRQLGSSLKLLLVAEGLAQVYPRLAPTCEWDTAAAHIIVTEAGGSIIQAGLCDNKGNPLEDWRTALAKNQPLVYNKQDALNPFFVVYGAQKPKNGNAETELLETNQQNDEENPKQ